MFFLPTASEYEFLNFDTFLTIICKFCNAAYTKRHLRIRNAKTMPSRVLQPSGTLKIITLDNSVLRSSTTDGADSTKIGARDLLAVGLLNAAAVMQNKSEENCVA